MSQVVRLSDDMINSLEQYRLDLIAYYQEMEKDNPDIMRYDTEKWENATYNEIISRALYMAAFYLKN